MEASFLSPKPSSKIKNIKFSHFSVWLLSFHWFLFHISIHVLCLTRAHSRGLMIYLLTLNTPYLSTFICPSLTSSRAVFHSSPSVSLSIFVPFHFLPPHVVLLSIPLYSFPPSPPLLSSLAHIWFLSLGLCVFGVTQSSPGLPAHMCACFADGDRETACVHVCELMGLPARSCFLVCVW